MPKRTRGLLISVILIAAAGAALFLFQSRWQSLFPKVAAIGEEFTVAERTLTFSVNATGVLRATSVQNFGATPEFGNYWQFQIVNLTPEGKQVKQGDALISFDAQKVRDDMQRFKNELDQAKKELEKTKSQIDLERQALMSRLAAFVKN